MGRPQKQTVDYFPHDSHASDGDTLTVLQNRFGNNGYAFWFKLLEKLAATEGHWIDCSNQVRWQVLLAKLGVDELLGVEIMKLLVEMQAVDKDLWKSKIIWCQNLVNNLSNVYKNRRQELPKKPVSTTKKPVSTGDKGITPCITHVETPQSKLKETKVDYNNAHFEQFWSVYPKKKSKVTAEKAFRKINPDEQLLAAMRAIIERAKKSEDWLKEGGKYIPYPASWLNARRWEDEGVTLPSSEETTYYGR